MYGQHGAFARRRLLAGLYSTLPVQAQEAEDSCPFANAGRLERLGVRRPTCNHHAAGDLGSGTSETDAR